MPSRIDRVSQTRLTSGLRSLIDTAIRYPTPENIAAATSLALMYPEALRSPYLVKNLGGRRWDWLTDHGVIAFGEATKVGSAAVITEMDITT